MHKSAGSPVYLQLAGILEGMIKTGVFRPGERIPSVRRTALRHEVSVTTVLRTYGLLEDRRLIEARPKAGFYVQRQPGAGHQPSRNSRRSKSLSGFPPLMSLVHDVVDPDFVRLGGGHPDAALLPGRKLARAAAAVSRAHPDSAITCDPAPGCPRLRVELSRRSLDWGCSLEPDDFIITNGCTEALYLALSTVARAGDTVMLESPAHYGVLNILSRLGLRAVAVPSDAKNGIGIPAVRSALAKEKIAAMVVTPNYSNPLGSFMPQKNRTELMALAADRGIPVIEDDVNGDLPHEGRRPHCLKALDREGLVILCSSFSKTLAPGYRVGYMAAGRFQDKIIQAKTALNFSNAPLMPLSVAEFLRSGGYDRHLRSLCRAFHEQTGRMRAALKEALPEEAVITDPAGGFVLWAALPGKADALELFHEARRLKISIAPGHLFSPAAEFRNCLRISCGHPWDRRTEDGVALLGRLVKRLAA